MVCFQKIALIISVSFRINGTSHVNNIPFPLCFNPSNCILLKGGAKVDTSFDFCRLFFNLFYLFFDLFRFIHAWCEYALNV